ncbi:DNA repair protein RadC [Verrucomicrobiaceae bacterium 227]
MADGTRIHDLPDDQKPREKMASLGAAALSNEELLAIFLRTGTKGCSAIEIGRKLISKHGGIVPLAQLDLKQLCKEHGLGLAKACQIQAAFELGARAAREGSKNHQFTNSEAVYQFLSPQLSLQATEKLIVLSLDSSARLIRMHEITSGTSNQTLAAIREILRPVLIDQACNFILAHNHPSGSTAPSGADLDLTKRLTKSAREMEIDLLDHVIIGRPLDGSCGFYSFADNGKL